MCRRRSSTLFIALAPVPASALWLAKNPFLGGSSDTSAVNSSTKKAKRKPQGHSHGPLNPVRSFLQHGPEDTFLMHPSVPSSRHRKSSDPESNEKATDRPGDREPREPEQHRILDLRRGKQKGPQSQTSTKVRSFLQHGAHQEDGMPHGFLHDHLHGSKEHTAQDFFVEPPSTREGEGEREGAPVEPAEDGSFLHNTNHENAKQSETKLFLLATHQTVTAPEQRVDAVDREKMSRDHDVESGGHESGGKLVSSAESVRSSRGKESQDGIHSLLESHGEAARELRERFEKAATQQSQRGEKRGGSAMNSQHDLHAAAGAAHEVVNHDKQAAAKTSEKKDGDWKSQKDPKSGNTYWYNTETKKTTWDDPNGAAAGSAPAPTPAGSAHPNDAPPKRTIVLTLVVVVLLPLVACGIYVFACPLLRPDEETARGGGPVQALNEGSHAMVGGRWQH